MDSSHLPSGQMTPEQHAKLIFNKLDTNKDGVLTREEFILGTKSDSNVMNMLNLTTSS